MGSRRRDAVSEVYKRSHSPACPPSARSPLLAKPRRFISIMLVRALRCSGPAITGFVLAGKDEVFHWANDDLRRHYPVQADAVPAPVALRYAHKHSLGEPVWEELAGPKSIVPTTGWMFLNSCSDLRVTCVDILRRSPLDRRGSCKHNINTGSVRAGVYMCAQTATAQRDACASA